MHKTNLRVAFQHATPLRRQRCREFSETVIFPFFPVPELLSLLLLTFPRERFIHFHSRANPTGTRGNSRMLALELIADAATTLHLTTLATWRFVRITYNGNSLIVYLLTPANLTYDQLFMIACSHRHTAA